MKNLLKFIAVCFVLNFMIPAKSMADEISNAEEILEIDDTMLESVDMETEEIIVSATRVERELMDVPMSVSVITQEDIKENPSTNIANLLKDIPGVMVDEGTNPGLVRVSIRGEEAERTLILIDGQRISDQKSMSGAAIMINPANIDRVEVIKGPSSVLYGSDAIGGVLNIITKKNSDDVVSGNVSLGYFGAYDGFTQSANMYGSKNGWEYNLMASNGHYGDKKTPFGNMPNTGFDEQDFRGNISYDFNEMLTVGVMASYFRSESGTSAFSADNKNFTDPIATMDLDPWEVTKTGAFLEAKNITNYLTRVRADVYYQTVHKNFTNHFSPASSYIFHGVTKSDLNTIGASLQTDWLLGDNHYLIAGYEFYYDTLDSTDPTTETINMGRMGTFTTSNIAESESSQMSNAFYLAMESTLPADFTLHYGVRYTHVKTELDSFSRKGSELTMSMGSPAITPFSDIKSSESETDSRPVFNIGLVWTGIDNLALRASWAQGFRAPTLSARYVEAGMMGGIIYPNEDLDAETSDNFEIGARYNNNGYVIDLAAFYSMVDDYITTESIPGSSSDARYINVGKANTYGLEASMRYDFENGFSPYVWATIMRREYDYENGIKTYDSGTPLLSGRAGLMYHVKGLYNDTLDINANFYVSGQTGSDRKSSSGEISHYDGFATLNLGIGADIGKNKNWNIQMELLNLLNRTYYINSNGDNDDIPEAGINANLKLTYKF